MKKFTKARRFINDSSDLKICFVASFTGNITQAGDLANYFRTEGADVIITSTQQNVILRALDILGVLFCNRNNYDFIIIQSHSYLNFMYTIEVLFFAKIFRKKFIIMYLGGAGPIFFKKWGKYISWVFKRADAVVVGSGFLEREFIKINVIPTIIPAVMKFNEWKFKKRITFNPKILWLRQLTQEYNPFMAIDVIKNLKQSGINAFLTFVGKPVLQSQILSYSKELDVINNVEYAGFVKKEYLQNYYDNHDIFINTTHIDNQPRSILEAQACGLPVVTTNVGGCPFMIEHNHNGFLVNDNDSAKMSEYIIEILKNSAAAKKIVSNAYINLNKYQWVNIKPKWIALFNAISLNF